MVVSQHGCLLDGLLQEKHRSPQLIVCTYSSRVCSGPSEEGAFSPAESTICKDPLLLVASELQRLEFECPISYLENGLRCEYRRRELTKLTDVF